MLEGSEGFTGVELGRWRRSRHGTGVALHPAGRVRDPGRATLPRDVTVHRGDAVDILEDAGFTNISEVCTEYPPSPSPSPGPGPGSQPDRVTAQNPAAGTPIRYETAITLTVSKTSC